MKEYKAGRGIYPRQAGGHVIHMLSAQGSAAGELEHSVSWKERCTASLSPNYPKYLPRMQSLVMMSIYGVSNPKLLPGGGRKAKTKTRTKTKQKKIHKTWHLLESAYMAGKTGKKFCFKFRY